jgi:hypothetical protein
MRFGPVEGEADEPDTFERLAAVDFAHPVLRIFDDPERDYLTTVRFYRHFSLERSGEAVGLWPLARYSSGRPALIEGRYGRGVVVQAAFAPHSSWTNLALKPEFVPLVLRLVAYAARAPQIELPSLVEPGSPAELVARGDKPPSKAEVADPAGQTDTVPFVRSAGQFVAAFEQTQTKGFYAVSIKDENDVELSGPGAAFAVNVAPAESDLRMIGRDELTELFAGLDLAYIDASAETQQLYGSIEDRREVWRHLIFIMFAVMAAEFIMATGAGGKRAGERRGSMVERIRSWFAVDGALGRRLREPAGSVRADEPTDSDR